MIAIVNVNQIDNLLLKNNSEQIILTTTNSISIRGSIGGYIGGIPVNRKEISGVIMAIEMENALGNSKLPMMIGKNIGKKALPSPTR